jgi:dihydroxy-acid dehydratase
VTDGIAAVHRDRGQLAYLTGKRIVEMVHEDLRPSDIMTRAAFENAIVLCSAIGGSSNAPVHLNAIAAHLGVPLDNDDWERIGHAIPLLVDLQPAGRFLGEDFHRAGGGPAVVAELLAGRVLPHPEAPTVNGKTIGQNCEGRTSGDREVVRAFDQPILADAGFLNLKQPFDRRS